MGSKLLPYSLQPPNTSKMSRVIETTVFTVNELTPEAFKKAHERYCNKGLGYDWWDFIFSDFTEIANILGIDIATLRNEPSIYFRGFCSQGDGACFAGDYAYAKGSVAKIKEYAPKDTVLHQIAIDLREVQRRYFYKVVASVSQPSGHYVHEKSVSIDVMHDTEAPYGGDRIKDADQKQVEKCLERLMQWLYKSLEKENEYLMSEEYFKQDAEANGWEFKENGKMI